MEPNRNNQNNDRDPGQPQKPRGNFWGTLLVTLAIVLIVSSIFNTVRKSQYEQTTFTDFMNAKEAGQLAEVEFHADRVIYLTKEEAAKDPKEQKASYTGLPFGDILSLAQELKAEGVIVDEAIVEDNSGIMMVLYYALMIGIMFFLMNSITKRMSGEGAAFFSYVTFFVDDNWVTTEMPTWFVIGGIDNKGALRDVWTSNNYGINWTSGGENLFVPGYIMSRGYASVVICDEPINSTFSTWHSIDMMPLPQGYRCLPMRSVADENKVPYIYMFGGKAVGVNHYDQVWRATINRLRFEPIP